MSNKKPGLCALNMVPVLIAWLFIAAVISSCSGGSTIAINPSSTSTKLLVINTSPDVGPVAAFINGSVRLGTATGVLSAQTYFRFAGLPTYYGIPSGNITLQLRTPLSSGLTSQTDSIIVNKSYTLFLMGLSTIDSLTTLLTIDTTSVSAKGTGKIRFINASPRTPPLDLSANGTVAFTKTAYAAKPSGFMQIPIGIYDFKVTATGAPSNVLTDLPLITIQDGRNYTLYTKGLVGRTDTAALNLNVINNQ